MRVFPLHEDLKDPFAASNRIPRKKGAPPSPEASCHLTRGGRGSTHAPGVMEINPRQVSPGRCWMSPADSRPSKNPFTGYHSADPGQKVAGNVRLTIVGQSLSYRLSRQMGLQKLCELEKHNRNREGVYHVEIVMRQ